MHDETRARCALSTGIKHLKRELLRRLPLRLAHLRWLILDPSIESRPPRNMKYQRRPERWLVLLLLWRRKSRER